MTIETGRPADCSGRPEKECAVYDLLERLDIPFTRADHPAAFTMEECEAVSQALHTPICKNLFLCNRQKTAFYLLLLPASKPFRTKEITARMRPPLFRRRGAAGIAAASDSRLCHHLWLAV